MAADRADFTVHEGGRAPTKKVAAKRATKKATSSKRKTGEQKSAKKTVSKAAADGNRRELLIATRDRVAKAVDDASTPARDLAALTRRLLEISKDIEAIDAAALQEERDREETPDEDWDESAI